MEFVKKNIETAIKVINVLIEQKYTIGEADSIFHYVRKTLSTFYSTNRGCGSCHARIQSQQYQSQYLQQLTAKEIVEAETKK